MELATMSQLTGFCLRILEHCRLNSDLKVLQVKSCGA